MADAVFEPEDEPLNVQVVGGRLVITIGVACLGKAILFCPSLIKYDEDADEYLYPEVTDPLAFAKALETELCKEEEDGTTLVHQMLDEAAMNAVEGGADGIHCPGD